MNMTKQVDLNEFARRVERLCDFFIAKKGMRDGSKDLLVIEELKEDAADIQFGRAELTTETLSGLDDFMKGGDLREDDSGDSK